MARVTRILIATTAVLATTAACSGGGGDDAADSAGTTAEAPAERTEEAPANAPAEDSGDGQGAESTDDSAGATAGLVTAALPAVNRSIIHTASLSIETEHVADAATEAASITTTAGGFVADESSHGDDSAHLTLKIPVDAHAEALTDLEALGEVTERNRSAEDVTDQVTDTESRIDSQRASIARTRQLLETASDIDQIIRIEDELSRREADLDALLRKREDLSALSALATVDVSLTTPEEENEPQQATGFLGGLQDGWNAFTGGLGVAATALGAALPFLVLAGLVGAPILWWRRRRQHPPAVPHTESPTA